MRADIELVQKVKDGDQLAYSELVTRHQQALYRVIFRYVKDQDSTEDVVQEAFVKAYQKIHQFESRSSFKSWLFRIAINTAKNKLRANKKEHLKIEDVQISRNAEAESALLKEAVKVKIKEEIEKLPMKQKTALTLRVFEDMSFKEIAGIMECPYDTAKANYRHALMKLKASLSGDELLSNWLSFTDEEEHITERNTNTIKYDH
ncbi:MAG: RNA polymerase sigma factor [Bdellovibrionales bacterium]